MKEIIETIILNLVDNKDAVEITEKQDEKSVVFEVKVANEDMGKVIGKQGRTAALCVMLHIPRTSQFHSRRNFDGLVHQISSGRQV